MEKKVKRRKFNFFKLFIFLLLLFVLIGGLYFMLNVKVKNIIVEGNSFYSDDELIINSGLYDYPKFAMVNKRAIVKKMGEFDLIDSVKVYKEKGFVIRLKVKEKKILYLKRSNDKYVLSDGSELSLDNVLGIPTLINFVPEDIEDKLIKSFSKIDKDVINRISEIEYSTTDYDKKRFLLYMNDGNSVYITLDRINLLNKYVTICNQFNGKKGILYLDSGNYFEIKEN